IGAPVPGAGNLIAGNAGHGVSISHDVANSSNTATGNLVAGNTIGGTATLGNTGDGVAIVGASAITVGGTATGAGNVIAGNAGDGVHISGDGATLILIAGNRIGTNAAGTAVVPNGHTVNNTVIDGFGVLIEGRPDNTVGGTAPGAGNGIAGNLSDGV